MILWSVLRDAVSRCKARNERNIIASHEIIQVIRQHHHARTAFQNEAYLHQTRTRQQGSKKTKVNKNTHMLTMSNASSGPFRILIGETTNPCFLNLYIHAPRQTGKQMEGHVHVHFLVPRLPRRRPPEHEPTRRHHPCELEHLVFDVFGPGCEPVQVVHDDGPRE